MVVLSLVDSLKVEYVEQHLSEVPAQAGVHKLPSDRRRDDAPAGPRAGEQVPLQLSRFEQSINKPQHTRHQHHWNT